METAARNGEVTCQEMDARISWRASWNSCTRARSSSFSRRSASARADSDDSRRAARSSRSAQRRDERCQSLLPAVEDGGHLLGVPQEEEGLLVAVLGQDVGDVVVHGLLGADVPPLLLGHVPAVLEDLVEDLYIMKLLNIKDMGFLKGIKKLLISILLLKIYFFLKVI